MGGMIDGWIDGMESCVEEWVNGKKEGGMNRWVSRWINGEMSGKRKD